MKNKKIVNFLIIFSGLALFGFLTGLVGCNQSASPISSAIDSSKKYYSELAPGASPCPTQEALQFPCGCHGNTPVENCGVTPTATPTPCSSCKTLNVTYARQRNPLWNTSNLGAGPAPDTIGNYGCLLSCYSMIANISPPDMNQELLNPINSFSPQNGLIDGYVQAAEHWSIIAESNDDSNIIDALCRISHPKFLNYVIAHVEHRHADGTIGTHYIVVNGQAFDSTATPPRCRFTVLDPGDQTAKYLDDTTRYPQIDGLKIILAPAI